MPNRVICDVFIEMRKCVETQNYSYLPGLIEEAQVLANRMEAALHDYGDIARSYYDSQSDKKREVRNLRMEIKCLTARAEELKCAILDKDPEAQFEGDDE